VRWCWNSLKVRHSRKGSGVTAPGNLGKYLSPQQLDALEVRRSLLVRHFDELIAGKGEAAVLYDFPSSTAC
jgi:hypothetical protein